MPSLESQFQNIQKKIRQEAVTKMQAKMERAATKTMSKAKEMKDFHDVTGNLYKSIAAGTFYNGTLMSIHHTPGPNPTRPTLAKGEKYDLERYYSGTPVTQLGRPFRGKTGAGGENGVEKSEEVLFENDGLSRGRADLTWQLKIVAGVDYAKYVEAIDKHDVLTSLREYLARYYKRM